MTARLVYFAWVREQIGLAEEEVPLAAPMRLDQLLEQLRTRSPGHRQALGDRARLRAAVDQEFRAWDTAVEPGAEVAIFPPVTGG